MYVYVYLCYGSHYVYVIYYIENSSYVKSNLNNRCLKVILESNRELFLQNRGVLRRLSNI